MDKRKKSIKDYEKEGVIYTPTSKVQTQKPKASPPPAKKPVRRKKKTSFAVLFAFLMFAGVAVCMAAFVVAFSTFVNTRDKVGTPATPAVTSGIEQVIVQDTNKTETVTVIKGTGTSQLELLDLEKNKTYNLMVTGATVIRNKYGEPLVFAELKVGDIVDISFDTGSNALNWVNVSAKAFDLSKASNVKIDSIERTITIGNDHYFYNDDVHVTYNDTLYDIKNIDAIDILSLKGYKNTIWSINVVKSHGQLLVTNKSNILSGTLEIDTGIYMSLNDSESFELLEGSHRVVVKGSNIEPYVKEIAINESETTVLDLAEVQLKAGVLVIKSSEEDAIVTVNGIERVAGEPLALDYGDYEISVTKQGFLPFEQSITFNTPQKEISAQLVKEAKVKVININTDPEGADVFVDNAFFGITPLSVSLEYGVKEIRVRKSGYLETTVYENIGDDTKNILLVLQSSDLFIP